MPSQGQGTTKMASKGQRESLSTVGALGRGPTYMRVSTPANLDLALEGLVRKVLREQPKQEDIYAFAAEYFETLVEIRDKAEQPNAQAVDICPGRTEAEASQLIKLATSFSRPEYSAKRREEEMCTVVDADHVEGANKNLEEVEEASHAEEGDAGGQTGNQNGERDNEAAVEESERVEEEIALEEEEKEKVQGDQEDPTAEKVDELSKNPAEEEVTIQELENDKHEDEEEAKISEVQGNITEVEDEVPIEVTEDGEDKGLISKETEENMEQETNESNTEKNSEEVNTAEIEERNNDANEKVLDADQEEKVSANEEAVKLPDEEEKEGVQQDEVLAEEQEEKVPDDNEDVILEKTDNQSELPNEELTEEGTKEEERQTEDEESKEVPKGETAEEEVTESVEVIEGEEASETEIKDDENKDAVEENKELAQESNESINEGSNQAEVSDPTEKMLLSETGGLNADDTDETEKDIIKEFIEKEKEFATLGNCTKSIEVAEVYDKVNMDDEIANVLLSQETTTDDKKEEPAIEEADEEKQAEIDEVIANVFINQEPGVDGVQEEPPQEVAEEQKTAEETSEDGHQEPDIDGVPKTEASESLLEASEFQTNAEPENTDPVLSEEVQGEATKIGHENSEETTNQEDADENNDSVNAAADNEQQVKEKTNEESKEGSIDTEANNDLQTEALQTTSTDPILPEEEEPQPNTSQQGPSENLKGIEVVGALVVTGVSAVAAAKLLKSEESNINEQNVEPEETEESVEPATLVVAEEDELEGVQGGEEYQLSRKKRELSSDLTREENAHVTPQPENSEVKPTDEDEAVLEAIFRHSAEGAKSHEETPVLESKEEMVDGFISAFANEDADGKESRPEEISEVKNEENSDSVKEKGSENVGENENKDAGIPAESIEGAIHEETVSENPIADENESLTIEMTDSEILVTTEQEGERIEVQKDNEEVSENPEQLGVESEEQAKNEEVPDNTEEAESEQEVEIKEKNKEEKEVREINQADTVPESKPEEEKKTEFPDSTEHTDQIPIEETQQDEELSKEAENLSEDVHDEVKSAVDTVIEEATQRLNSPEGPPEDSTTPAPEDEDVVLAPENRQMSVDDDTEVVVASTENESKTEEQSEKPDEITEETQDKIDQEEVEQCADQAKISKESSSESLEDNPFISAKVLKMADFSAMPSLDTQEIEDESDVIVPLNADIGTIEELDEDVWSSQVSAVRAAMIIQKNYRRYLQKRNKALKNGDIDRISGRFGSTKDYSSTESTSSATREQHNENKLERLDTAIENKKNNEEVTMKSPRERLIDFSNANKTIDDSDVWGTLEKELDSAATTIQHGYKGYKDRQRERLRREDAVQLTSQESGTADSPKSSRLLGTGEMHDMIVPEEAQL